MILSLFDYADITWDNKNNVTLMYSLQTLQNKAAKVILGLSPYHPESDTLETLQWKALHVRCRCHRSVVVYKFVNSLLDFDRNLTANKDIYHYNTRSCSDLHLFKAKTNWRKRRFYSQSTGSLITECYRLYICDA